MDEEKKLESVLEKWCVTGCGRPQFCWLCL